VVGKKRRNKSRFTPRLIFDKPRNLAKSVTVE
jgi:hypothetical protein